MSRRSAVVLGPGLGVLCASLAAVPEASAQATSPDRPCDLRNYLHANDTVGDMVIFDKIKDLRFIDVSRVCPCMDGPVCIPCIPSTDIIRFSVVPSHRVSTGRSEW